MNPCWFSSISHQVLTNFLLETGSCCSWTGARSGPVLLPTMGEGAYRTWSGTQPTNHKVQTWGMGYHPGKTQSPGANQVCRAWGVVLRCYCMSQKPAGSGERAPSIQSEEGIAEGNQPLWAMKRVQPPWDWGTILGSENSFSDPQTREKEKETETETKLKTELEREILAEIEILVEIEVENKSHRQSAVQLFLFIILLYFSLSPLLPPYKRLERSLSIPARHRSKHSQAIEIRLLRVWNLQGKH